MIDLDRAWAVRRRDATEAGTAAECGSGPAPRRAAGVAARPAGIPRLYRSVAQNAAVEYAGK
ncbi:hypothetical protein ACVCIC_16625 [Burkholderia glumae]|uniref:hypothetical protein n=1 Tax=Burkholderia glumae TaxID=337 RepID=UPI000B218E3C|nr:hypothetical protein [Burkholderia glumae]MCM2537344.1 hypothetical protein [Burkholderia glumae]MCQ0029347.1 hypothetical protein [Burkholderia glumae]MCQ0038505.1 hypothetical protein [Burkholderia glumae]QHE09783.1 hypothetical protein GQR88_04865 [Burkholderia glumae AU6208]QHP92064.1 hypothetical protein EXE55_14580 [Burkholderia glumae]